MDELERRLLYRLLDAPGLPSYRAQIRVGQLPDGVTLTFPEGTRVLGSLEHPAPPQPTRGGGMHRHDHTRIEVDFSQGAEDWLAAFTAHLDEQWQRRPLPGFSPGGFLPAEQLGDRQWYSAYHGQILALNVQSAGEGGQATLNLNGMSPEQLRHWDDHLRQSPAGLDLRVPSDVTVHPQGGGGSGDTMVYGAMLEGTVSAADLLAHFAQQLEAQTWRQVTSTQQGSLWSAQWVRDGHGLAFVTLEQVASGVQATLVLTGRTPQASGGELLI